MYTIVRLSSLTLALATLSLVWAAPAHAEPIQAVSPGATAAAIDFADPTLLGGADLRLIAADPECIPGHSLKLNISLDYRDGLFAWRRIGNWDICVNDNGTAEMNVIYTGDPYKSVVSIHGHRAELDTPGAPGWALEFARQDFTYENPSDQPHKSSLTLDPGKTMGIILSGHFFSQRRDLRLTVKY